ncbi:aspartate 1-decarboxylase [Gammaproteobacteria bacterium]|nr:aspartate 1-decarboxylase [Gammaproteobacteria bacterium]MDA7856755.1 aspartate 1-decarboxylase [Gammaproteobacteria bacterium]MDA8696620.1 aspartate 1-decarboxylase [Gammaproteobacteria bacterium]MDA8957796.1 aspartate 1-decarboxylase [Gammaproteobacteria bacterium]MDA9038981.1 aspartate 1-decarboxylase [Gammaproteobacteria bacterium]|tara:strand:+ start:4089 stop:4478 length:390 start_codon:yes stop_codon:yes gene_type:complete
MNRTLLKSKLHRINVTQVELDYEGSCAVDKDFLDAAGMQEYEKVDVYNVTNGERFSTYLILAESGSKTLSVNGAAAHKASVGDVVIICTYGSFDEAESVSHKPTLVYFDKTNSVTNIKNSIPEQKLHSV